MRPYSKELITFIKTMPTIKMSKNDQLKMPFDSFLDLAMIYFLSVFITVNAAVRKSTMTDRKNTKSLVTITPFMIES